MGGASIAQLMNLSGKVAIVTGGAMGIGFGIASRLSEAGASVVIADMNFAAAEASAAALLAKGRNASAVETDVSDAAQVERMVETAVARYGGVDILVNNAGIYPQAPAMGMETETFEKILAVNLKGAFLCCKAAAAHMITQGRGGKIINITSIDALHPSSIGLAAYDASKHGLWGFTKNLALELAPHKIWVNAVAPGGISTPGAGAGKEVSDDVKKMMDAFLTRIPMQRLGESDEIGTVVLFLATGLSSYMTGTQIVVDGGALLA
jgi:2-deoxy-D-gluconate 3-dehydrogenase